MLSPPPPSAPLSRIFVSVNAGTGLAGREDARTPVPRSEGKKGGALAVAGQLTHIRISVMWYGYATRCIYEPWRSELASKVVVWAVVLWQSGGPPP